MNISTLSKSDRELATSTIRMLAADAVEKAKSGHPGLPMGCAEMALTLWTHFIRFNPADPHWVGRDRFILSAGHGSALLYTMLHLSGYDLSLDDLKSFRQLGSRTPGHPEYGMTAGVETTTGPLGQGFVNGVGMAIAQKMTQARVGAEASDCLNHRIFGIISDGDLMEGISTEAASVAGHLGLGQIVYLYDSNHITIDGRTDITFTENIPAKFEAMGWHVQSVDGHDVNQLAAAIQRAIDEPARPSIIVAITSIGKGSPTKQNTSGVHGAPLGADEMKKTREALGWPLDQTFVVPGRVREIFQTRVTELSREYETWQSRWKGIVAKNPEINAIMKPQTPVWSELESELMKTAGDAPVATRVASGACMQVIAKHLPSFVGGSADLAESVKTWIKGSPAVTRDEWNGRNLNFGIREHAMGAILNGMALYGTVVPFGSTFLVFSDYMRPAIRLAALMKLPVKYVFTHDSMYVGEDGPTHQPVEHVSVLRMIPNLVVYRPADAVETAACWLAMMKRTDGPSTMVATRQNLPLLPTTRTLAPAGVLRGGYVLESDPSPELVVMASGSEVSLAFEVMNQLRAKKVACRLVSVPSLETFVAQEKAYIQSVIPAGAKKVAIEAGVPDLWYRLTGLDGLVIGMTTFGESGPAEKVAAHFGFTPEKVIETINHHFE